MPSKAYWVEEPWIMSADYEGRLTVADFDKVTGVCLEALKYHRIYFIVEMSKTTSNPVSVSLIPSLLELINHKNTAAFAFIGANRFARITVPSFVRRPNKFFDTREEGLAYLRERMELEKHLPESFIVPTP
jgi:hypothetical protein